MSDMPPVSLRAGCLNIRHKMMYCDSRHQVRGMVVDESDTAVYFCVKTQEVLGPAFCCLHR